MMTDVDELRWDGHTKPQMAPGRHVASAPFGWSSASSWNCPDALKPCLGIGTRASNLVNESTSSFRHSNMVEKLLFKTIYVSLCFYFSMLFIFEDSV